MAERTLLTGHEHVIETDGGIEFDIGALVVFQRCGELAVSACEWALVGPHWQLQSFECQVAAAQ